MIKKLLKKLCKWFGVQTVEDYVKPTIIQENPRIQTICCEVRVKPELVNQMSTNELSDYVNENMRRKLAYELTYFNSYYYVFRDLIDNDYVYRRTIKVVKPEGTEV